MLAHCVLDSKIYVLSVREVLVMRFMLYIILLVKLNKFEDGS